MSESTYVYVVVQTCHKNGYFDSDVLGVFLNAGEALSLADQHKASDLFGYNRKVEVFSRRIR